MLRDGGEDSAQAAAVGLRGRGGALGGVPAILAVGVRTANGHEGRELMEGHAKGELELPDVSNERRVMLRRH
ncbi:hypothetical protein RRF57_009411 [Xylaria bambusicola]|uniref:Uncharacterized protein n=1 Tax=Xylaria bambusicola TaxID=326684 RepID=A0AAN7ZBY3_9PEZI